MVAGTTKASIKRPGRLRPGRGWKGSHYRTSVCSRKKGVMESYSVKPASTTIL